MYSRRARTRGFGHAGLGYTNIGALGEVLHGYNRWIPSEIFQQSRQSTSSASRSGNANWRPLAWMQNDGTVGIDLADRDDLRPLPLERMPELGHDRQGVVSISQNNNRLFTVNVVEQRRRGTRDRG